MNMRTLVLLYKLCDLAMSICEWLMKVTVASVIFSTVVRVLVPGGKVCL
jgi:hypothetical protein